MPSARAPSSTPSTSTASRELFAEVWRQDLEGIVAKHRAGRYGEDEPTRWLKIKNPEYSQARIEQAVPALAESAEPGQRRLLPRPIQRPPENCRATVDDAERDDEHSGNRGRPHLIERADDKPNVPRVTHALASIHVAIRSLELRLLAGS